MPYLLHSYMKDAKKSYTYIFEVLQKVLTDYECEVENLTFVVDFERGAIGAIRNVSIFNTLKIQNYRFTGKKQMYRGVTSTLQWQLTGRCRPKVLPP